MIQELTPKAPDPPQVMWYNSLIPIGTQVMCNIVRVLSDVVDTAAMWWLEDKTTIITLEQFVIGKLDQHS